MMGLAALGSLGMGIYGAVQGAPSSNVALPPPLPDVQQAGGAAFQGAQGLGGYNTFGQNLGLAGDVSMGLFNNPYQSGPQNAANFFSPLAMGGGLNTFGAGSNLYGGSNALMNTAFDPQGALYARTAEQLQDQTRTAEAARGISTTPYGAGVEGQVMSDFNINWQNAQLQRMLSGLSGAGQGYGQASQMQQQAPLQYMQGAAMPYSTFNMLGGNQLGALQGYGQFGTSAAAIPQMQQQDYSQYAIGGQGQNVGTGQLGLQQANQGFNQTQAMGQGLGWGLGALGNSPGWGNINNWFGGGGQGGGAGKSAYNTG